LQVVTGSLVVPSSSFLNGEEGGIDFRVSGMQRHVGYQARAHRYHMSRANPAVAQATQATQSTQEGLSVRFSLIFRHTNSHKTGKRNSAEAGEQEGAEYHAAGRVHRGVSHSPGRATWGNDQRNEMQERTATAQREERGENPIGQRS